VKRILFYPDAQIPYHNPLMMRSLHKFIHDWQPDEVCIIGDFMDFPEPSQWNTGTKGEFEGSVFADSEIGKRALGDIRRGYEGHISFIEGNHDLRPRAYLNKWAPALAETDQFHVGKLLDFDGFNVVQAPGFYEFAPGWVATHGHLGLTLSSIGGRTANLAALKINKSVVMGHTHRLGIISETRGYDGKGNTYTGVEVGHMMDVRPGKAPKYLKYGYANWQAGFAVAFVDGNHVSPLTVPMKNDGSFIFEGEWFTAKEKKLV
jgi:metallophosphoesterase superfamily enzyme